MIVLLLGIIRVTAAQVYEGDVAYIVEARVDPDPILAYRGYGPSNADWQQVIV